MGVVKRNYGWIIVAILAVFPLIPVFGILLGGDEKIHGNHEILSMLYHISGEFAIRWMTAVLTCTPFFILFGVTNLFVRQAMGIATAFWSIFHFIIFINYEGLAETFTQVNYIAGFIAVLILIPMLLTSNRKSMKWLKEKWKLLQSGVYLVILLSLLHVALLNKSWMIYAIIVGIGFALRMPVIKQAIFKFRTKSA